MRGTRVGIFATAFAVLSVALALCACAGSFGPVDDGAANDQDLPQIKIGADVLEPFFYMGRAGEYVGIDADIAREACRRAGLDPVFVNVAWAERDEKLADGTVDCLWSAFAINGREDAYDWTGSYLDTTLAMLTTADNPFDSLQCFQGQGGVAVRTNSIAEQFFLNGASLSGSCDIPLHSYGTADMAKTAFVKGYTDAWVSYKIVLDQVMADNPGAYRYVDDDLVNLHLGVAFRKGCGGAALTALNEALADMRRDGTINGILERYVGAPESEGAHEQGA